jgi:hypothetical protein
MAKIRGPLHSDSASGKFADALVFATNKGVAYCRQLVTPKNPKSDGQIAIRALITDASVAWKDEATVGAVVIDAGYKLAFDTLALPMQISGFALYMKQAIALNWVGTPATYGGTYEAPAEPTV